jgi:hypothetical protein
MDQYHRSVLQGLLQAAATNRGYKIGSVMASIRKPGNRLNERLYVGQMK